DIFDALSKTLPTKWRGELIVVMDEILINPPYTVESCKVKEGRAGAGGDMTLARVRKVLEGVRGRLGLGTGAGGGKTSK
ncbi:hypothetical protein HK102_001213, partial [Quaeritorhiza haematococci]